MDDDYKIIFYNLNKLINIDNDPIIKSLIFESFIKGLQIGLTHQYLDFKVFMAFLKTNV